MPYEVKNLTTHQFPSTLTPVLFCRLLEFPWPFGPVAPCFDNIGGLTYKAQSCQNSHDMDLVKHVSDLNRLSWGIGWSSTQICLYSVEDFAP